jgi:Flp pilus assembly protein TadD
MIRRNYLLLLMLAVSAIIACGPDTIFLRPALDTPEHHVKNGHCLLNRGKIDAANAEFMRAKSLDVGYAPAYVGLALIQAHQGNVEGGLTTLERARELAATPEQGREVEDSLILIEEMQ